MLAQSPTFGYYKNLINKQAPVEFSEMNDWFFTELSKMHLIKFGFVSVIRYLDEDTLYLKLYYLIEVTREHKENIDWFVCSFYAQEKFKLQYSQCNILDIPLDQSISAEAIQNATNINELETLLQTQLREDSLIGVSDGKCAYTNSNPHKTDFNLWYTYVYQPYVESLKPKRDLEFQIIGNELILTWGYDRNGYQSSITFEWRNILIKMIVSVNVMPMSREDIFTMNVNGESSRFGWGRRAGGQGSIGTKPSIYTLENYLSIHNGPNKIVFKDNREEGAHSDLEDENVFKVISIPIESPFGKPKTHYKISGFKSKRKPDEITLYEYSDGRVTINSCAYFEEEKLVVDHWKLGGNYEDEYLTLVSNPALNKLYDGLGISNQNKEELLTVLQNIFQGEKSYASFQEYLKTNNIDFEERIDR
jgi:hypothetical protein